MSVVLLPKWMPPLPQNVLSLTDDPREVGVLELAAGQLEIGRGQHVDAERNDQEPIQCGRPRPIRRWLGLFT